MEATFPIAEVPWHLVVNGARTFAGTFTPGRTHDLAAGRLLGEGFVRGASDLHRLDAATLPSGAVRIEATVDPTLEARARLELGHRADFGCGLRHFLTCDPEALGRMPRADAPPATEFAEMLHGLFAASDSRFPDGGVHAAALWDGTRLVHQAEDVGRHNAVDRVLGAAFLGGEKLATLGLVLSARISGQMAMVAARAGVAWVASRSLPTSLASEIAAAAGLPLIARAGRGALRFGAGGP